MIRIPAVVLFTLSFPLLSALGSTYYVDFAGGADANAGTAAAPFQHCPGDGNAAGKAAAAALSPGDSVVFRGGVTYPGTINCPSDGVTYDGNTAGGFGTGRAIISGQNSTTQKNGFTAINRSGITFSGIEMELFGGHGAIPWTGQETSGYYGYAIYLDACTAVTVRNCYFHDIGDWQNIANENEAYMEGVGIAVIDSGSAISIAGNEFTRIGRGGVLIEPKQGTQICTGISITGNNFHDFIRWGVWLCTGNTNCTLSGVTIDGNRFHDIYQYDTNDWLGVPGNAPHVDCIIAYIGSVPAQGGQTLGTAALPITISNNSFFNNATVGAVQNSAVFLTSWGGRVVIVNNTFVNTLFNGNGAIFFLEGTDTAANPPPDYWVINNSFYDTTYAVTLESDAYPLKAGATHILNNIFYKPDAGAGYSVRIMDANSTPTQVDYNLYYTARPDNRVAFTPAGPVTLAQLQLQGYELHGLQADPRYADISSGLGAASSSNNLSLQSGSPAIGAGLNLSPLFTTDNGGLARAPAPSAWDQGAFAFTPPPIVVPVPVVPDPVAPTPDPAPVTPVVVAPAPVVVSTPVVPDPVVPTPDPAPATPVVVAPAPVVVSTPVVPDPVVPTPDPAPVTPVVVAPAPVVVSAPVAPDPVVPAPDPAPAAPVVVPAVSVPAAPAARLVNFSVRGYSSSGGDTLIAGFSVTGSAKSMLVRGIGPALAALGVPGGLATPRTTLFSGSQPLSSNDAWGGTAPLVGAFAQTGAFTLDPASRDDAILVGLQPGSYTAQVANPNGASGITLAEIYDADAGASPAGRIVNFSGRAYVGTGSAIMIAGFVISGTGSETLLIRAVGPSLAQFGVPTLLAQPELDLFQNSVFLQHAGAWNGDATIGAAFAAVGAFALTDNRDAAMIVTLPAGQYTAQVSGGDNSTGICLLEVYELP